MQEAEYLDCPGCAESMLSVGLLGSEDYVEYGEGTFYAFSCKESGLSTVNFQQT